MSKCLPEIACQARDLGTSGIQVPARPAPRTDRDNLNRFESEVFEGWLTMYNL